MRNLSREDLIHILYGCTILGTGGGGTMDQGIALIDEALNLGKTFTLASFEELEADDYVGTPYGCGAISPLTQEERDRYARLQVSDKSPYLVALEQLEHFLGRELKGIISTELGGMNTATAFYSAAMTGRLIMDGDPAGRSVPALQHSTYFLNGIPMCPMAVANQFGESAIFTHVYDDERGEDLVRALAVVSQNQIAVVDHVNTAEKIGKSVITGAISYAEKIGKAFQDAVQSGKDFVSAVRETGRGRDMFRGVICESQYETRDGYTFGTMEIAGSDSWEGHRLKIWYQNENIISWLDGEFYVTVPDLIVVLDEDHKFPQLNPYAQVGTHVSVLALPAPEAWTTTRGLEVFGPRSFGYDVDWRPFCK